jgi:hypothetical protein
MDLKPTVFSVVGFLVPGIILGTSLMYLLGVNRYGSARALVAALPIVPDGTAVLVATLVIGSALALTAAVGAILSDAFTFVARQLILRPLVRARLRENVQRLFAHQTLESLVRADMDARESYVYLNSCGLDLDWYAGRVRMMGASGVALLIAAAVAGVLGFTCWTSLSLVAVGLMGIAVALYRSTKFDEYVAAASAVLIRRGVEPQEEHHEA